jgi:hypothetical protein
VNWGCNVSPEDLALRFSSPVEKKNALIICEIDEKENRATNRTRAITIM